MFVFVPGLFLVVHVVYLFVMAELHLYSEMEYMKNYCSNGKNLINDYHNQSLVHMFAIVDTMVLCCILNTVSIIMEYMRNTYNVGSYLNIVYDMIHFLYVPIMSTHGRIIMDYSCVLNVIVLNYIKSIKSIYNEVLMINGCYVMYMSLFILEMSIISIVVIVHNHHNIELYYQLWIISR